MAHLFFVRHGESEWNSTGQWTGWTDISLSPKGIEEAKAAGAKLAGHEIHSAHTSLLKRTHETLRGIEETYGKKIPTKQSRELNERHYGVYTGKNKWQIKEEIGDEAFTAIRRGWDVPIPDGETLKAVHDRAVPYYKREILPELAAGKNVLVAGHGNTIRALIKHIENIHEDDVANVEITTGEIITYKVEPHGMVRVHAE
ncbi:MAG: 2,3-bisphosphoglycerate-dependent phosphoglycerate mutase [Candidatus Pacebacteria bacterium]|nr:2,3-bisphosphoglycerate-dependent phosphoglycerate mutase [Candidatus Paceibacterota bacterium]